MKKILKENIKLGVGSLAGQYAIGGISNLPGMPVQAKGTANIVNAGIGLANIGQLAKTAKGVTGLIPKAKSTKKLKW